jgi:hypothetical protein
MEIPADEIKRLQGCINNLISVLALPALWAGDSNRVKKADEPVAVRVAIEMTFTLK